MGIFQGEAKKINLDYKNYPPSLFIFSFGYHDSGTWRAIYQVYHKVPKAVQQNTKMA
jgi:hypothetical protein